MANYKKNICVDFDGVLHNYDGVWKGLDVVSGPPVEGAIEWLSLMASKRDFQIHIYSSRSTSRVGVEAMQDWLLENGMDPDIMDFIQFPTQKPIAYLTIDDRAICFKGEFPTVDQMLNFKPWNRD